MEVAPFEFCWPLAHLAFDYLIDRGVCDLAKHHEQHLFHAPLGDWCFFVET
jgi:hypothetical protein